MPRTPPLAGDKRLASRSLRPHYIFPFRLDQGFGYRKLTHWPFSYQSHMPVVTCTPSYEKPELWVGTSNWHGRFRHSPNPSGGQAPALHLILPPSTYWMHIFVPIAHPGLRRHTKV